MSDAARVITDPLTAEAAALVVTAYPEALSPLALSVDAALDGMLTEMRAQRELRGRFGELHVIPTLGRLPFRRIVVIGLGDPARLDSFRLHNAYHFAGAALRRRRLDRVIADIDPLAITALGDAVAAVRCAVTGLLLGNVEPVHSDENGPPPPIESVAVSGVAAGAPIDAAIAEAIVLADATNRARHWAKLPGNALTPDHIVERTRELFADGPVAVEVMRREALERAGAGALLGVAAGSAEEPAMITLRYSGGSDGDPVLALIGKGITFDTGGISIKPAAGMELMKYDMSGAAAVINAVHAIATLGIRCNVIAVVPATENMPGGRATKPGDVLRAMDGTTIEVTNTDAEGRLVLADALTRAREMGATHLVDVATLTGAAVIALGHVTTALMSNDDALAADVTAAADVAGDRVTRLPMHPEYETVLDTDVADLKNSAGREAGSITGAVFVQRFAHGLPWVHLDIAGTAWNDQGSLKQVPKGPSGTPLRTLVQLARRFADRTG